MSTLLFGQITFARPLSHEEQEALGFRLAELAHQRRFGLQLACNIVQPEVYEALGRGRVATGEDMPFLLTDSPIMDVSDALANKYAPEYPDAEPRGPLSQRLTEVQMFLRDVLSDGSLSRVTLYISEAYDGTFDEDTVTVDRFAERAARWYEPVVVAPNVRFSITRESAL